MSILDEILARPARRAWLAHVPGYRIHGEGDDTPETCMVVVIARATGGDARSLVRCMGTGTTAHVPAASVRP